MLTYMNKEKFIQTTVLIEFILCNIFNFRILLFQVGAISKEKMVIGTLELVLDFMLMQQKKNGRNIIGCFHTLLKRFEFLLMALTSQKVIEM